LLLLPIRHLLVLSLAAALSPGCTATKVRVANETTLNQVVELSRPFAGANYKLGAGDLITVRCYYNPQLDDEQTIRPDGVVSLSLLGELRAAGKTAAQLSTEITQGYSQFFTKPNSVVVVRQFNNYRIFTAGELKTPGAFSLLTGARTVLESISVAGGITDDADLQQVVLIRRLPNQAAPMVAELDLKSALSGADPTQNVVLMPGDMVYVPKSGMADFNLFMKQFLLNNLNASTFVGVNPPIPGAR
jgi:protein involved in polysaccharide export with SLBB domain